MSNSRKSLEEFRSKFLKVHNFHSNFSQYYHIDTPFSVVLEVYRSDLENKYFKIANFSPNDFSEILIDDESLLSSMAKRPLHQHDFFEFMFVQQGEVIFKIENTERIYPAEILIDDESLLSSMAKRPLHQHDFFEFMFVQQGEVIFKIENTERIYPAGTGCIVNCNLRHLEKMSSDFRIFFLNLSKNYVKQLLDSISGLYFDIENNTSLHTLFHFLYKNASTEEFLNLSKNYVKQLLDSISGLYFDIENNTSLHTLFHFLYKNASTEENTKKEYLDFFPVYNNSDSYKVIYNLEEKITKTLLAPVAGDSFFINGFIFQLFDHLSNSELYHTTTVDIDYNNDFLIFTKLTHLLEDSNQQLSRHELSKLLNYSGDYLNRISKKYSGMTLFEYSMTFIIRKAEYYLLKTDYSISHIISILGFTNRTHFYHIFYSKHHMTPKEYRLKYWDNSYQNN